MNCNINNCPLTLNTTRICADNLMDISIEISRIGFSNMKPNAVILVNKDEIFDGIAATPLVHLPINAAILFTDCSNLRKETLNEIKRLSPKGYKGIHVFLVGNISKNVSLELNEHGFKAHRISGSNHYETACMIPCIREEFKNILIISGENYSEGIAAAYWSAHHGDPILYIKKNNIPSCVLETIKMMHDINIYIIGSTKTISRNVENYLSKLDNIKHLDRIDGENPYEIAVNFAKYKNCRTDFGWGRNYKEGHAFTFGELNHPMEIIAGVLFAHMGKHTPLLTMKKDKIPEVVERYIKSVKPMPPKDMPMPPFMHGFILGSTKSISYDAQVMIEDILSIDYEMINMKNDGQNSDHMCMHHMHNPNYMMDMKHDGHDSGCCMHMNHQHHMADMEHDGQNSDHMCMHHMHNSNYMMDMKHDGHDSGCCMHMNHQHHMEDMEHEGHDSDNTHMHFMHHSDYMMPIKQDKSDLDCMEMHQMHHKNNMINAKDNKHESNYMGMFLDDQMMQMKHGKCHNDSIDMHNQDKMIEMKDHKHDYSVYMQIDHEYMDEDEKHNEDDHETSRSCKVEYLNCNYRRVNIDEILG